jgi:sodium-dependent dicarboxylate transporter 2/3/5
MGLFAGLAVGGIMLLMPTPEGMSVEAQSMAAVALLMAIWWITEATHIAITALLPLPLFPLLGIMPSRNLFPFSKSYLEPLYFCLPFMSWCIKTSRLVSL